MSLAAYLLLLAVVWLAPHMPRWFAVMVATLWLIASLLEATGLGVIKP